MDFLHDLFHFEPWCGIQSCWILNLILLCFSVPGLKWKKEVSRSRKNIECSILGLWICPSPKQNAPHELLKDAPQRVAFKFNASLQEKTKIVPHILSHPYSNLSGHAIYQPWNPPTRPRRWIMRCSTYRNKSTIRACRARLSHDRASSMSPRSIRMDLGQKFVNVLMFMKKCFGVSSGGCHAFF